jgi:hypothetical protein
MLDAGVENAGLKGIFADVISADEVKTYKSSPRVYGLVSKHLDVPKSAIAFVSSNFWDIAGAKSYGFWTCWVNRCHGSGGKAVTFPGSNASSYWGNARESEEVSGSFVTLNELSMLIKKQPDIASSEITPKNVYLNRRNFLVGAALAGAAAAAGVGLSERPSAPAVTEGNPKIDGIQKSKFSTSEAITPYKDVTNYNNYYEFSTDKYGPAGLAKDFRIRPWTLSIEGLLKKKQVLDVDSIIKLAAP